MASVPASVLIGSTMGAVSYAQTGIQKAYGDLFALKNAVAEGRAEEFSGLADGAVSRFAKLRFALAPVSAAFDSSVVSLEKVRTVNRVVK